MESKNVGKILFQTNPHELKIISSGESTSIKGIYSVKMLHINF